MKSNFDTEKCSGKFLSQTERKGGRKKKASFPDHETGIEIFISRTRLKQTAYFQSSILCLEQIQTFHQV